MAWALDFDDFGGVFCGVYEYPMLNKLKRVLTSSRGNLIYVVHFNLSVIIFKS